MLRESTCAEPVSAVWHPAPPFGVGVIRSTTPVLTDTMFLGNVLCGTVVLKVMWFGDGTAKSVCERSGWFTLL